MQLSKLKVVNNLSASVYPPISIRTVINQTPELNGLWENLGLTDLVEFDYAIGSSDFVERFEVFFDAKIKLHTNLPCFLSPESTFNNQTTLTSGYLIGPEHILGNEYAIHVQTLDKEKKYIDTKSVIHLIGHYIEQRNAQSQRVFPNWKDLRATSIIPAARLTSRHNQYDEWDIPNLLDANVFASWINGCIACHILGVDPRLALIGMAMDSCINDRMDFTIEEFMINTNLNYFINKPVITEIFNNVGKLEMETIVKLETDKALCQQIDNTSSTIINNLLYKSIESGEMP